MNRREFLRNAAIIAGGIVAADQMELLERLAPRRLLFPGADFGTWTTNTYASSRVFTTKMLDDMIKEIYCAPTLLAFPLHTPLIERQRQRAVRTAEYNRIWKVRLHS